MLRLTVAPPAADFVLAPVIARFLSRYTEISIDVSVDRGIVDIVAEHFDAEIRPDESIARHMITVLISDEMPFVVAASPAYLREQGTPAAPQSLTEHACVRLRFPDGALAPWRFSKKRRTFEVQVEGPLTANELPIASRLGGFAKPSSNANVTIRADLKSRCNRDPPTSRLDWDKWRLDSNDLTVREQSSHRDWC